MLFAEQNNDSRPRATGPVHVRTCDTFLFPPIKLMVLVRWLNPHVIAINFFYHSFYLSIFYIQVWEKKNILKSKLVSVNLIPKLNGKKCGYEREIRSIHMQVNGVVQLNLGYYKTGWDLRKKWIFIYSLSKHWIWLL